MVIHQEVNRKGPTDPSLVAARLNSIVGSSRVNDTGLLAVSLRMSRGGMFVGTRLGTVTCMVVPCTFSWRRPT